jgi:hypothetical protein
LRGAATLAELALALQRTASDRATTAVLARQRRTNTYPDFTPFASGDVPIAGARAKALEQQLGITVPPDGVLDAPWVGRVYPKGGPDPSRSTVTECISTTAVICDGPALHASAPAGERM